MNVQAEINVTLRVRGTAVRLTPTSPYVRVLANAYVQIGEASQGTFGEIGLGQFSHEFQRRAMEALEADGRKLVAMPDPTTVTLTTI